MKSGDAWGACHRPVFLFRLVLGLTIFFSSTLSQTSEGFGTFKVKVQLHRKLPAVVKLSDTSFNVVAVSHSASGKEVADVLPDMLSAALLKNENSLREEKNSPTVVITCAITNYETPPRQTVTRNQTILDKKNKLVQQPKTYFEVTGQLDVTYKVQDRSGKTLDSGDPSAKYSREFEQGTNQATDRKCDWRHPQDCIPQVAGKKNADDVTMPPTPEQLRQELISRIVAEIAPRLVNTDEILEVLLAEGSFGESNKMAEKGMWNRYLESLEMVTPLSDPKEDAYRLYNIGVANEALGYVAEDRSTAKKFFEEAAIDYGKAIEANPKEKYFLDPQTRVETAVAYYKELTEAPVRASDKEPIVDSDVLTNDKIIQMFKSGVDEDSIIAEIKQAPKVDLKLGPNELIDLANHGIKGKIPAAIRERINGSNRANQRN